MSRPQWNNHATRGRANKSPYGGFGYARHCMTCDQWRDTTGGGIDKRTRLFKCAECKAARQVKEPA